MDAEICGMGDAEERQKETAEAEEKLTSKGEEKMTVKELKARLDEMPDEAEVIVVDGVLYGNQIAAVKHRESTRHQDGVVEICTYA